MNSKKFWFGLLAIGIPLALLAAQIRWYNDAGIPQKTTMDGAEVVSIQQTGPNAYRWAYLRDVLRSFGVTNYQSTNVIYVMYGSNYYAGDTYVSNYFATNVLNQTVVSNYFFDFIWYTNIYQTNVTIEQYIAYNTFVSNTVITNISADTYVSNYFVTNLFPTTTIYVSNTVGGAYIANLNGVGTNTTLYNGLTLQGDGTTPGGFNLYSADGLRTIAGFDGVSYFGDGYGLTNLNIDTTNVSYFLTSNYVNNLIVTNVTVQSNVVIKGHLYVTNININAAAFFTNSWAGPTNNLSWLADQYFTTTTPCAVTGIVNVASGVSANIMLSIYNAAGSNINFYPVAGTRGTNGSAAPTIVLASNQWTELWFKVVPQIYTNLIIQNF